MHWLVANVMCNDAGHEDYVDGTLLTAGRDVTSLALVSALSLQVHIFGSLGFLESATLS
jgi:hypothetical protein